MKALRVRWSLPLPALAGGRAFLLCAPANDPPTRAGDYGGRYWPLGLGPMTPAEVATMTTPLRPPPAPETPTLPERVEPLVLAPSPSGDERLPGMAEWLARQKRAAAAALLRTELESLTGDKR